MTPLVAVYDACILYPAFLRDFLVWLGHHGKQREVVRVKWTGRIHAEWMRAVLRNRPDIRRSDLREKRRRIDHYIPGCRVRGYRRWEQRLTLPDRNDRHVLAAALACVADVIVTFNLRDFPAAVLQPFGVTARTPDDFVCRLMDSGIVVAAAAEQRAALTRPALSVTEYLDALRRNRLPGVAAALPSGQI